MRLKRSVARLVMWERVCRVATVGTRGVPHLVPVCHVMVDGKVYFASGDDGRKVLNIRENPRVAVTVDLYSEDWANLKGVMIQGAARLIERGPRFRRIRRLLYDKYLQYASEAALDESDSMIVEVVPDRVFTWGLDE
jgi:PPOX class probable F420-dependent enzyme